MTIFELVKIALDELYAEGKNIYSDSLDQKIKEQMTYLSKQYLELNKAQRTPINYKDPATRFAYVFKYVAAHGDYLVQLMERLRGVLDGNLFTEEHIWVSCIGGGPGSDIIGVLKYLDDYKTKENVSKIICYLLDKEQAWADTWTEFNESLNANVQLSPNFQPLDVTNKESWKLQQKFLKADIFTMSYFVSEVKALDENNLVTDFWKSIFSSAKPGALFLYTDNGHSDFNQYFDSIWKDQSMECLLTEDNKKITPRFSEQAAELGIYKNKFNQSPKLASYLSWRVLRKK